MCVAWQWFWFSWWLPGAYCLLSSGYCLLPGGYWWSLLVTARYCSCPLLVWTIWGGFKYVQVLNIRKFSQIWQGSEYSLGCSYIRVLNIPGFQVCQVCAYANVAEGSEYAWIWLNKPEYALVMSQYAWICLNNAEYDWIYGHIPAKNSAEYARILNVSDAVQSIGSLNKLLSSYRDRDVFRTLSSI